MENVKNYLTGYPDTPEVEEEVYADHVTVATVAVPQVIEKGTIRGGYDAVIVNLAATHPATATLWVKRAGKQVYPNGLHANGLRQPNTEGTGLYIPIKEGVAWELGATNTGGPVDMDVRFRIRLFRKK